MHKKDFRIEGLDSLRFFAFLMVYLFHTSQFFFFGFLGVDFFFVLSSFLLTFLALSELKKTGEFSRRNFFIRRLLRIFPLYYFLIFFSLLVIPFFAERYNIPVSLPEKEYLFWIFASNYDQSAYLLPLKFFWSIAVEEQFYLLFLLLSLLFKNYFKYVVGLLIIGYLFYFMADVSFGWEHYKNMFFHMANFGMGMGGGYLFFQKRNLKKETFFILLISFTALFLIPSQSIFFNLVLSIWFVSLIFFTSYSFVFLKKYRFFKMTEYLGKYTYGLYMYSGFVIIGFNKFVRIQNLGFKIILELSVIFILSYVSYHLFEKQFLSLKQKFRTVRRSHSKIAEEKI